MLFDSGDPAPFPSPSRQKSRNAREKMSVAEQPSIIRFSLSENLTVCSFWAVFIHLAGSQVRTMRLKSLAMKFTLNSTFCLPTGQSRIVSIFAVPE
jgi:hypothetical protein